ncbi:beta-ketoacyl synthase [Colletotrichum tabaci]|uniref:Beta-ketoacyl synthase n=1 Tax=Colletotrichum tabaci TaxID=1209068 RepID=A0AAV9TKQ4_9PEZI
MSTYKRPQSEPIAIVGTGCRFAGDVTSPSKLWDLLTNPRDLSQEVPSNRFHAQGFYHADGEYHGATNATQGYFLEQDHRVWDAGFFNITPKEAEAIDPQQRIILEVVYEALESAGYNIERYAGRKVAVFAGLMTADYDTLCQRDDITSNQYFATGNSRAILSNRISYFFNFRGPSMTIDTACSSSLVALHQAVLSLRSGECEMACVAGANLMITPEQFISEASLHMLSPTGKSRMWDVSADGYARGEGFAALFVKPLSQALRDGDSVISIIRETGVNSDGRTQGITMPSPLAQAELIRDTYRRSGLDALSPTDRCQYFEAHGTGTQAGDPREAQAISTAFFGDEASAAADKDEQKLVVGSVKTVIGHTEGAAGLAGLLKVVHAMINRSIPPNLHLETLNPSVRPFYGHLHVPVDIVPWPRAPAGQPLRGSVNSFGFGGTNSHAIIERYEPSIHDQVARHFAPALEVSAAIRTTPAYDLEAPSVGLPLLLSAKSQKSLVAVVQSLRDFMGTQTDKSADEVAWNLYAHRSALTYRTSVSSDSREGIIASLDGLLAKAGSSSNPELGVRAKLDGGEVKTLGIFTGQGAQWSGMGRQLFHSNAVYRTAIESLEKVLRSCPHPPTWSLVNELIHQEDATRINIAALSQPLCTAVQIALIDLLASLGVSFHTVVGHSSGEIAAAYAAGVLSARDAMLISYYRGKSAHLAGGQDGGKGMMMAVGMTRAEASALCERDGVRGRVWVAASNAPSSVTLSGDVDAVKALQAELTEDKKFARLLVVDTAYHSAHMERPAAQYMKDLAGCGIEPRERNSATVWVSSVYADGTEPSIEELKGSYWRDNMVKPVSFYEAIDLALTSRGPFASAVEVGPHPALKGPVQQTVKAVTGGVLSYAGVLDRKKDDRHAFAEFLGFTWNYFGTDAIDWKPLVSNSSQPNLLGSRMELPSYPWDHSQMHFRESRVAHQYQFRQQGPHELLGVRTRDDTEFELRWRNILKLETVPWIQHHKFQGQALLPASAYCVLALDAARAFLNGRPAAVVELTDLEFMSGISLESNTYGVETLVSLSIQPSSSSTKGGGRLAGKVIDGAFTITSCYADGVTPMQKNFTGNLRIYLGEPSEDALPARDPATAETLPADTDSFYQMMSEIGLDYTGPFRALEDIDRRYNYCSATLQRFHEADTTGLGVSPATLDSCFHSVFAAVASPGDKSLWTSFLPRSIDKIRFNLALCDTKRTEQGGSSSSLVVDSVITQEIPRTKTATTKFVGDMGIYNARGEMEIQVEGLMVASFANSRPEDDKELYLTTVMDLDPEHEMVTADLSQEDVATERVLLEACERVARFYVHDEASLKDIAMSSSSPTFFTPPATPHSPTKAVSSFSSASSAPTETTASPWPQDTPETLDAYIAQSPFQHALSFIRLLGENIPDVLPAMLSTIIQEAKQLYRFRSHVSRVVSQLAHRYPRMRVLGLTDPETALTEHVIDGLGTSFVSYTVGTETDKNLLARFSSEAVRRKIDTEKHTRILENDGEDNNSNNNSSLQPFDLVVLTTSVIKGAEQRDRLKQVRSLMKPGGYLILIHESMSPLRDRLRRAFGVKRLAEEPLTPPEWPDLLDECGFARVSKNAEQFFAPDFSLIVRQAESDLKQTALAPLLSSGRLGSVVGQPRVAGHTVIIGAAENTAELSTEIHEKLAPLCDSIDVIADIDALQPAVFNEISSVVFLADLDEPMMSTMTPARLELFRALMAPEKVVLWVTMNSRAGNPEHAATFGFARSMLAEIPSLKLQMLDLDSRRDAGGIVAETFLRLGMRDLRAAAADGELLWSHENEIFMEHGRRLVPRMLPWKEGNDRVNCPRRLVSDEVNTLRQCVEVVSSQSGDGSAAYTTNIVEETDMDEGSIGGGGVGGMAIPEQSVIQVAYSSVEVVNFGLKYASHVCIGKEVTSGELCLAMAKSNSSYVTVPDSCVFQLSSSNIDPKLLLGLVLRYIVALSVAEDMMEQTVLLLEPDAALLECMREVFEAKGATVVACTTTSSAKNKGFGQRYIHPYASNRELKALFPAAGAAIIDFLPEGSELSEAILDCLPENCEYHSRFSLLTSEHVVALGDSMDIEHLWEMAIGKAITNVRSARGAQIGLPDLETISVPQLLDHHTASSKPFQMLDWRAERKVQHVAKPLFGTQLLRPYKTYVLVGLTRDMGQSLCNLFFEHGARHLVLASRNPNMEPRWIADLAAKGCQVRMERLDVTSVDSVRTFKQRLASPAEDGGCGMPPVAGIVNGAMVLDDRVFAQMDVDTWDRVLRPKTVGSSNLDAVFCEADMEFFIMTSSFAAPGGHGGQSNYAAANMYMNGLAANRRLRGLAGSVLNMGVVYGLGLLHRERNDIYAFLERDGYPPISERDIHHMFLEAIVAGRPVEGQVYDITTGLSRYAVNREDLLHWQRDARFSHFTFDDGEEAGGEGGNEGKISLKDAIRAVVVEGGVDEVARVLTEGFARYLEVVLGQGEGSVKGEHSVGELGMDSLVAVEVRGWFWKVVERDVSVMKILGSASVAKLCHEVAEGYVNEKSKA